MRVILHKLLPFMVLWHADRSCAEALHGAKRFICFTPEYSSKSIVGFLDFPHHNGFQLSAGALEISGTPNITLEKSPI